MDNYKLINWFETIILEKAQCYIYAIYKDFKYEA